jgi:aryl-alcohol dehydrogenase-like predicted oxidoreductase
VRYRPLGGRGQVISAVSLILQPGTGRRRPGDWVSLIYAALECGVSGFEIRGLDPVLGEGMAQAFSSVDRRLLFVALRLSLRPGRAASLSAIGGQVQGALATTGLDYLDAVLMEAPEAVTGEGIKEMAALKSAGLVRALGVAGSGDGVDALVGSGRLDVLAADYSLLSGWAERRRVRAATACDMGVIGCGSFPKDELERLMKPAAKDRAHPLAGTGGYGFLERTKDWDSEDLCLAYALTEPSLASVLVEAQSIDHLEQLAAVPDRELPSAVAAQIEMARFSSLAREEAQRTA